MKYIKYLFFSKFLLNLIENISNFVINEFLNNIL